MEARISIGVGELVEMPAPENFDIEQREICRMERTASGRLVKDVIAVKKEIRLKYVALEKSDFLHIRRLYEDGQLVKVEYREAGVLHSIEAYVANLPRKVTTYDTNFVRDVEVLLEEV